MEDPTLSNMLGFDEMSSSDSEENIFFTPGRSRLDDMSVALLQV
jgi:hypothetical protein